MRSLLLADAETDPAIAAARQSGADAILLGQPPTALSEAQGAPPTYIRLARAEAWPASEIRAIVAAAPEGIVLDGAEAGADILRLSAMLAAQEAIAGLEDGAIGIVAMLATAGGLLDAGSFRAAGPRLRGIAWDAAAVAASIGAASAWTTDNQLIAPCRTARSICLLAAANASMPAYDTAHSTSDISAFRRETESACQEGFAGKLAVNAEQAATINEAFGKA